MRFREKIIWVVDAILALVVLIYGIFKLAKAGDKFYIAVLGAIIAVIIIMVAYFLVPQLVVAVLAWIVNAIIGIFGGLLKVLGL